MPKPTKGADASKNPNKSAAQLRKEEQDRKRAAAQKQEKEEKQRAMSDARIDAIDKRDTPKTATAVIPTAATAAGATGGELQHRQSHGNQIIQQNQSSGGGTNTAATASDKRNEARAAAGLPESRVVDRSDEDYSGSPEEYYSVGATAADKRNQARAAAGLPVSPVGASITGGGGKIPSSITGGGSSTHTSPAGVRAGGVGGNIPVYDNPFSPFTPSEYAGKKAAADNAVKAALERLSREAGDRARQKAQYRNWADLNRQLRVLKDVSDEPYGPPAPWDFDAKTPEANSALQGDDWINNAIKGAKGGDTVRVYMIKGKRYTEADLIKAGFTDEMIDALRGYGKAAGSTYQIRQMQDTLYQTAQPTYRTQATASWAPEEEMAHRQSHGDALIPVQRYKVYEQMIADGDFASAEERERVYREYQQLQDDYFNYLMSGGDAPTLQEEIARTEHLLEQVKAGGKPSLTTAEQRAADRFNEGLPVAGEAYDSFLDKVSAPRTDAGAVAALENKLAALRNLQERVQQTELLDRIKRDGAYNQFEKWYDLRTEVGTQKTGKAWEGLASAYNGGDAYSYTDHLEAERQRAAYDELNSVATALRKKGYSTEDFRLFEAYKDNQIYQQEFQPLVNYVNEHPVAGPAAAAALQVATAPIRGLSRVVSDAVGGGMGFQIEKALGTAVKEAMQTAAQNIEKTHGTVWSHVYQYSVSAAESFVLGTVAGPATEVLMGLNAAVDTYDEAIERGIDKTNAIALGITSGVFEALFEHLSLEKIRFFNSTKLKGVKGWIAMLAKSAFTEGMEEVSTDIANEAADYLTAGGLSRFNTALAQGYTAQEYAKQFGWELVDSFLGGAFGGLGFGLAEGAKTGSYNAMAAALENKGKKETGRAIAGTGDVTALIDAAKESGDRHSVKLAERIEADLAKGKDVSRAAGNLYNRMQSDTLRQAAEQRYREIAKEQGIEITDRDAENAGRGMAASARGYVADNAASAVLDNEIGRQLRKEYSEGADWAESNRETRLDFARRTGAVNDRAGREMRTAEAVERRAPEVTKAVRQGGSFALVKNGFEGQYVGKEGQRSEARLGGIDSIGPNNEMMVVVDDDGKGGPHATAAFSVGEDAAEGTVQAADADTEILYLDAQAYLTGNADMAEPEQYGADYQYRDGATMSVAAANTALATYDSRVNPDAHGYMAWFFDAHKAGKSGVSWERYLSLYNQQGAAQWSGYITPEQLREAFRTGQMEFSPRNGVTRIGNRQLKAGEDAFIAVLDHIAQAMKTPIVIVDDIAGKNGFVSSRADVAVISLDADFGTFTVAAFHEIFHVVSRELEDSAGRHFISAVLNEYRATVGKERFRKEYDRMAGRYKEELQGIAGEDLEWKVKEEMAAQYFGVVASNNMDGLVKRLHIEGGQQLVQKVLDTLREFAQHLKDALKKLAGVDDATRHALRAEAEQVERILDLFTEAVRQTENVREERLAEQGETLRKAAETSAESGVRSAERKETSSYKSLKGAAADELSTLADAKQLLAAGADSEEVRKRTGWFKGYDGKWRIEIDDSKMELLPFNPDIPPSLNQLIDHRELFQAYPFLRETTVFFLAIKNANGRYNKGENSIDLNRSLVEDAEKLKETLIHEIQHAIQLEEGLSAGASPSYWQKRINNKADNRSVGERKMMEEAAADIIRLNQRMPEDFGSEMWEWFEGRPTEPRGKITNWDTLEAEPDPPAWKTWDQHGGELSEKYGDDAVAEWLTLRERYENLRKNNGSTNAESLYYHSAGEIEARDVAARVNLTAEERRNTRPDIDRTDVVFADGGERETFSLKSVVEETKELVAVHNLTADELLADVELGGFPMPSIAVTKASMGHSAFGDISVVFGRESIDPALSRDNKIYGGDAYTPTFPQVDVKINSEKIDQASNQVKALLQGYDTEALGSTYLDAANAESYARRHNGDLTEGYNNNPLLKLAFLTDTGKSITLPTRSSARLGWLENEALDYIRLNQPALFEKLLELSKTRTFTERREKANAMQEEVLAAINQWGKDVYEINDFYSAGDVIGGRVVELANALSKKESGAEEVDYYAAKELINSMTDESAYKKWLRNLLDGVIEKKGIPNGKDLFTPSGNRRSFDALHWEITLENVVKAMRAEQQQKGKSAFTSTIIGAAPKDYKSIEAVKKDIGRLKTIPQDEYDAMRKGFTARFLSIGEGIQKRSTLDAVVQLLCEAVVKYGTNKTKISAYLQREGDGWTNNAAGATDELVELVKEIQQMPTGYFEAKPQRAIGLDEIRNVILPDNAPEELTEALRDRGIPYATYPAGDEDARKAELNRREDLMFSKKVTDVRAVLAERTLGRDELGWMLDETAEFLRQARKTVDKAAYDAWIQSLRTGGRVPQRTALLKVVRQYNDPKVTNESNEALADRIVERLAEMTDAEYSVDALMYTLADAMYRRAAATETADTSNESREAIREVTQGRKYYINDGEFNYLVEQTAGTRRGMNEVFRRVYGFTLYPESEAERRGATDSVGSIPDELKKQGKSWQYERDEGEGNLWAILGGSYDEDVKQNSDVSTALQLYEMRDDMLPQARTLEDEVRDRQRKEAPDAPDRELWVAQTIYEEAYQDAARFAEDIIRLSPMRTLADAYEGTMEELRQAAKGVLARRAKEIEAIAERLDAAEAALGRAGDISEEQRQEAARLERQVKNLEDQLSVARYDLQKAKDAGQKDTEALEQRIAQLEKEAAGNTAELRKLKNAVRAEQRKVARRDEKIAATRQYYVQKRHEESVKRADTASRQRKRQRIRTKVRWLNDRLTSPAEGKYIPPEMRDGIAAFVKNFLQEDTTAKGNSSLFTAEQLLRLNAYYGRLQTDGDGWDSFFDEDVAEIIRRMSNADDELSLIGKRLADLTRDQLEKLEKVVDNLVSNVRNANRMFGNLRNRMLSADGDRFISQIDHKQPQGRLAEIYNNLRTGKLNMNMIKPIWLFKDVLGGEIERYFTDLQHARNAWAFRVDIGKEYIADKKKQYNYNKWQKETNSFTLDDGTAVTLTKDAVLQIYATWMRERQSITPTNHLMGGGIVLTEDLQKIQKKKNLTKDQQKKLEEEQTRLIDKKAHSLTLRDIETMLGTLTKEQKDYANDVVRFLSTTVAGWGNETSRELSGFDKFTEGYYFPYQSSSLYLYHQMGVSDDTRLKNSGFTKSVTMKASTPIVITGFSEVAGKHVIDMANYSTLALPLENMHRLVNYRNRQDPKNMTSVQASLNDVFGSQMYDYIRRFLNQMNGGVKRDSLTTLPEKLFSGFKRSAVAMNISVIAQQPSAIARAMALVNPKYFVATTAHWFDWKELQKYSGVARIKAMGSWDINTGKSTVDYVLGNSSAMDKWNQFTGKGAELADAITWSHIWNAVKRETAKKMDIKYKRKGMTEEFYQAAAERFNEVADYTQVYDATITRSQWMRSEDGLHKIMTQFMAEPTTSYNLLMFSGMKKNGNHINKAAAIAALVCNIVLNTALQSLVGAWRDKDKKSYWERYFKKFIEGVFGTRKNGFLLDSELNVANMIPFVQDIMSLLQGWDVSRSDMSLIADLIKSFNKLKEKFEKRDDDEALWDFMTENGELINNFIVSALNFSPVPFKTVYRDFIKAPMNAWEHIKDGGYKTTAQHIADIWKQNFDGEWDNNEALYNAVIQNDRAALAEYTKVTEADIAKYVNEANDEFSAEQHARNLKEKDFHNKVQDALKAMDSRIEDAARALLDYDYATVNRLTDAIEADGFDRNDVVKAIKSTSKAMKPPTEYEDSDISVSYFAETTDMKDLVEAAMRDGYDFDTAVANAVKVREQLHDQGMKDKDIDSETQEPINENFIDGSIDLDKAIRLYKSFTTINEEGIMDRLTDRVYKRYAADEDMTLEDARQMYEALGMKEDKIANKMGALVIADYQDNKFSSREEAVKTYITQTGAEDDAEAETKFDYYDIKAKDETFPLEYTQYATYVTSGLKDVNITPAKYYDFLQATKDISGSTTSPEWEAYEYATRNTKAYYKFTAKQYHIVQQIDMLFDTVEQKNAAYAAAAAKNNWNMSKLPYTPWQ